MALYERILVPTDGSEEGLRAVAHAIDLAAIHDAAVSAVYVINTASYNGLPMETAWEQVDQLLQDDASEAVGSVTALGERHGVDVDTTVVEGSPSTEILRLADRDDCDLIVMGTRGRGGIDRLLLGSVTEKVVRGARVPVLTIRVGEKPAELPGQQEPAAVTANADTNRGDPESDSERTQNTASGTTDGFPTG